MQSHADWSLCANSHNNKTHYYINFILKEVNTFIPGSHCMILVPIWIASFFARINKKTSMFQSNKTYYVEKSPYLINTRIIVN